VDNAAGDDRPERVRQRVGDVGDCVHGTLEPVAILM
jgi:hypothetical protein